MMDGMTITEILTVVIAVGGCVSSLALLVLNLRVQTAMAELRVDVANFRTESATDRADLYQKIMENMARFYISREVQEAMHKANLARLDAQDRRLQEIDEDVKALAQKVGDIS